MFDENNDNAAEEERFEEEWQQQFERDKEEEEKIWDDRRLSDFELLKGIMQSEYGNNEFSNNAEITET